MDKFFKAIAGLKQNKAYFRKLAVFCCVVFVGIFLFHSTAYADIDVRGGIMSVLTDWFISFGEFCIKMTVFFLYFFIQLAKYNNYLDVPTVQLGWTMVRDVANMFFVIVLLMISIGTILGLEQYQWNKTLVKLILAAVFINFSNLICGIFIDIAHVFTITFVNAVASTAGGNLIQMFSLDKMYDLIKNKKPPDAVEKFDVRILVGAVSAFLFAFLAMVTMFAYLVVMVARVVVLWVLIILSPIAFIAQVIPQTQTYAKEWWDKFGKQVAVAPVIVFFLWLAFATAGQGNLATEGMGLKMDPLNQELGKYATVQSEAGAKDDAPTSITWSSVTTWESMSNFLIPMAFLFVGIGVVGKMGVVGGGMVSKATDLFKNVATVATGYATGRWLAKKGWEGGKKGIGAVGKYVAWEFPYVGGRKWAGRGYNILNWARGGSKRLEDMGGVQRAVSYFSRRRAMEDKQLEARKARAELAKQVNIESSTTGPIGDAIRQAKGRLAAIEQRKKERDAESIGAGAAEELGKERQQHRFVGYEEGGKMHDYWWAKLLGITATMHRKDEGTIADAVAYKQVKKETAEKRKDDVVKDARKRLQEEGKVEVKFILPQLNKEDERLEDVGEARLQGVVDKKQIDLQAAQAAIDDKYKVDRKDNLGGLLEVDDKLKLILDPVFTAKNELAQYDEKIKGRDGLKKRNENHDTALAVLTTDLSNIDGKIEEAKMDVATSPNKKDEETAKKRLDKLNKSREEIETKKKVEEGEKKTDEEALKDAEEFFTKTNRGDLQKKFDGAALEANKKLADEKNGVEVKQADGTTKKVSLKEKMEKDFGIALPTTTADVTKITDSVGEKIEEKEKKLGEDREKQLKAADESSGVKDAQKILDEYKAKDEYKNRTTTPTYKALAADVEAKKAEIMKKVKSPGAVWAMQKAKTGQVDQELAQIEAELEKDSAKMDLVQEMIKRTEMAKIGEDAAKKFVEGIKNGKIADVFKKGADEIKKATEELNRGKIKAIDYDGLSEGARASHYGIKANYTADLSTTAKKQAEDAADTQYSMERFGMDTPNTAYKALIKKRMEESFTGVEREQAVVLALGSMQKLIGLQKQGKPLDEDQKAQMMANVHFLTKQAWSDDLLGRIVNVVNSRGQLTGKERQEAENLKEIFVDKLGWGKEGVGGKTIQTNRSTSSRTNDLHRLSAYAGDADLLQSENAVLKMMRGADKEKEVRGYYESAEYLAERAMKVIGGRDISKIGNDEWQTMAGKVGVYGDTGGKELKAFVRNFVSGASSAIDSFDKFKDKLSNFTESNELLADFKNMALQTAHLDDGGHTYYDMTDKVARGQLHDKAGDFILSDWRKLDVRTRISRLKTHSNMQMDEDTGTASFVYRKWFDETYRGGINKAMLMNTDGRNISHIIKAAADETLKHNDKTGALAVGHKGSVLVSKTYDEAQYGDTGAKRELVALKDVARDWAVMLDTHPEVLLAYLGENSGVKYEDAVAGEVNIDIGVGTQKYGKEGFHIGNIRELVQWVGKMQGSESEYKKDTEEHYRESEGEYIDILKKIDSIVSGVENRAFSQDDSARGGGKTKKRSSGVSPDEQDAEEQELLNS